MAIAQRHLLPHVHQKSISSSCPRTAFSNCFQRDNVDPGVSLSLSLARLSDQPPGSGTSPSLRRVTRRPLRPLDRPRAHRQRTPASTKYTKPFSYNKNVQDSLAPAVRNLRFVVHPEPTPRTSTDCYIQHGELGTEHTTKANSKGARTVKYEDSESPLSYIHI